MAESVRELELDGLNLPVRLRRRSNARRMTLSISRSTRALSITLPPGADEAEALSFAARKKMWILERLAALPDPILLGTGITLPFRGNPHRVVSVDASAVSQEDARILVPRGHGAGWRLERWLRQQARQRLIERSRVHADALNVVFSRLTVKDTRSRWGSCSSRGTLSYSWRAILAPDGALDYLAAHEVAHLREMNHSARFWRHVEDRCPDFDHWRRWLRANAAELHRYRATES